MTTRAHRFSRAELDAPLTDEQRLMAADAVRVFCKGEGGLALQKLLEAHKEMNHNILSTRADAVSHISYAEASGAVQTVTRIYEMFNKILQEAEKLNRE